MRRTLYLSAVAAVALAFAACSDASAPKGRDGSVTARAYVDRDASGSFTEADSALANLAVTLTSDDGSTQTANTDASGEVTFADVAPGSYHLAIAGNVPAGTALVTNPAPSAVVSFQGGEEVVDFRYVFFPGSISGRIYREDNGTPGFQEGADLPGAGLWVYLRIDSAGVAGHKVDSVQAGLQGEYTFARVAPGSWFIEFQQPTTITYTGATTQHVTVAPNTVTSGAETTPTFTGSLAISIAEARTKTLGTQVAVFGWVTVKPNTFTSGTGGVNSEIWVQDSTGGIAAFPVPSSATFQIGDRLQVTGGIGFNGGAIQIGTTANPPAVTAAGGTPVIFAPKPNTVLQARARTDEGRLVVVSNLTIASVPTGTGAAYTVIATSSAGDTLQIRVSSGTGIARTTFTVGNRYNVTGILSQFNGVAQLKPRSTADIALGQAITPIGTARTLPLDTVITIVGTVTVPPGRITSGTALVNSEIWVQDATGGIAIFPVPSSDSANYHLGDVLEITGARKANAGQAQLGTTTAIPTVTRLRAGTEVTPVVITGTAMQARTNEGQLVTLNNFLVTAVGTVSSSTGAYTVTGSADGVTGLQIRVNGPTTTGATNAGIPASVWTVGSTYSVTGVLSQFNGTAQIKPRQRSDVIP